MKKATFLFIITLLYTASIYPQVAINKDGSDPNTSSILHIKGDATNKDVFIEPGASGKVGMGTTFPKARLHIKSDAGQNPFRVQIGSFSKLYTLANGGTGIGGYKELLPENGLYVKGNVGVGTNTPSSSAKVDISSTDKGFLPPRVADTTAIASPAEGLMIYNQSSNSLQFYNGTSWSVAVANNNNSSSSSEGCCFKCGDYLVDTRDGHEYSTVKIGTQCWMAKNLNIGTRINGNTDQSSGNGIEKYCYDNDTMNCKKYGGLYQWDEAMQYVTTERAQGICPDGWHIPTDEEWKIVEVELGMSSSDADDTSMRGTNQGSKMAGNGYFWTDGNLDSNAEFSSSGFFVFSAGYRAPDGSFNSRSNGAFLWASKTANSNFKWHRQLLSGSTGVYRNFINKSYGYSVRCVRD